MRPLELKINSSKDNLITLSSYLLERPKITPHSTHQLLLLALHLVQVASLTMKFTTESKIPEKLRKEKEMKVSTKSLN